MSAYPNHVFPLLLFLSFHAVAPSSAHTQMVLPTHHDENGYHLGTEGEIAIGGNLDDLSDRLHLATSTQAVNLLGRLGVDPAIAQAAVQGREGFSSIQLEAVPMQQAPTVTQNTKNAFLFLPHAGQGMAAVYLLSRTKPGAPQGAWQSTGHLVVAGFTSDVSCEIVHLGGAKTSLDTPFIALHRVNLSHGSDGSEDETRVYAIRDGKLVELMHTPDYASRQQWKSKDISQDIEQQSIFIPFPDGSLEKMRTSKLNGHWSKVERRYWRWKPAQAQFKATSFQPVLPR